MLNKIGLLMVCSVMLAASGCASTLSQIDAVEADKYINKYMQEESKLMKANSPAIRYKAWVQAKNKKIKCKVYFQFSNKKETLVLKNKQFKVYWDGECKGGYAYGLGREFVTWPTQIGYSHRTESLANYKIIAKKPEYFVNTYYSKDLTERDDGTLTSIITEEGSEEYYARKTIVSDSRNINIETQAGYFGNKNKPQLFSYSSPFEDDVIFYKKYKKFSFVVTLSSMNEFSWADFSGGTIDDSGNQNGYFSFIDKNNRLGYLEVQDGRFVRYVKAPQKVYNRYTAIKNEIEEAVNRANRFKERSLQFKKQYTNKICKNNITVNFIHNDKYKNICSEELSAELQHQYDSKLSQIKNDKIAARERIRIEKIQHQRQAAIDAQAQQDASNILQALGQAFGSIGNSARSYQSQPTYQPKVYMPSVNNTQRSGTPIYNSSQCIGSVVNGQCMGTIRPSGEVQKRCNGAVVNGRCTGSITY